MYSFGEPNDQQHIVFMEEKNGAICFNKLFTEALGSGSNKNSVSNTIGAPSQNNDQPSFNSPQYSEIELYCMNIAKYEKSQKFYLLSLQSQIMKPKETESSDPSDPKGGLYIQLAQLEMQNDPLDFEFIESTRRSIQISKTILESDNSRYSTPHMYTIMDENGLNAFVYINPNSIVQVWIGEEQSSLVSMVEEDTMGCMMLKETKQPEDDINILLYTSILKERNLRTIVFQR